MTTPVQQPRDIEILSLAKIRNLSRRLARQIQTDRFRPELVIAIARGGFVPARLLCDYLDIYNLTCIRIAHYTGTDKAERARLSIPLNIDIRDMSVLLVDDVDDSGETLQLALTHLRSFGPAVVRSAVLHHKTVSSVVPEYYAEQVIHWRWITYPWAITEDMLSLIRKAHPIPADIETAIAYMAQTHGLRIPKTIMQDVYRLLA
jgi:hypoxanthine phosphoribosyltransferase